MSASADTEIGALRRTLRHVTLAHLLFGAGRHRRAEREVRAALAAEPDSPELNLLLAMCLSELGHMAEAEQAAAEAIRLEPDSPEGHKGMAVILLRAGRIDAADAAARDALCLAPADPHVHALIGALRLLHEDFRNALAASDRGLSFDPDNAELAGLRAIALSGLGQQAPAESAAAAALASDPQDAGAHAIRGFVGVLAGDFATAREHFREALRLHPNDELVRTALLEMLKARNPLYAALLRTQLWLSRRSPLLRLGLAVAGFAALRNATMPDVTADTSAADLVPIAMVVMAWVALLGTAHVLFNLTLLLDSFGRLVLRREEKRAAITVGAAHGAALAALATGALTGLYALVLAAVGLTFAAGAAAAATHCRRGGWRRRVATGGAVATTLLAAAGTELAVTLRHDPGVTGVALAAGSCVVGVFAYLVASLLARRS